MGLGRRAQRLGLEIWSLGWLRLYRVWVLGLGCVTGPFIAWNYSLGSHSRAQTLQYRLTQECA